MKPAHSGQQKWVTVNSFNHQDLLGEISWQTASMICNFTGLQHIFSSFKSSEYLVVSSLNWFLISSNFLGFSKDKYDKIMYFLLHVKYLLSNVEQCFVFWQLWNFCSLYFHHKLHNMKSKDRGKINSIQSCMSTINTQQLLNLYNVLVILSWLFLESICGSKTQK